MRVLVADADRDARSVATFALRADGIAVDETDSASEALLLAGVNQYDVVVTELRLADRVGIGMIQDLRRGGSAVPVLVLSAIADKGTIVRTLDAGADDYLVTPPDYPELKARVRALARRGGAKASQLLRCGNLTLDRITRDVTVDGRPVRFTRKELALVEELLLHVDQVVSRTDLLERVWDIRREPESNVVDALIARVRARLRAAGSSARINSRWGLGVMLTAGAAGGEDAAPR